MFKYYGWLCLFGLLSWTNAHAQKVPVQDFNLTSVGQLTYTQELNDIWGYQDETGIEYALVGTRTGTSIVSLANPAAPVELLFIPGATSVWRDLKTWGDYAYVTTDQGADGLLVIDLGPLPSGTPTFQFWQPSLTVNSATATLEKAHNLYIDEGGYCYIAGSNISSGETFILDVHTTPGTPIYMGATNAIYAHDAYARGDTLWTSDINTGTFSVYDVSNKTAPVWMAVQNTPMNFTHNAWISDDNNSLFTTDEKSNAWIGSYDVSDLNNIRELDRYRTPTPNTIPHNVHTYNDYLVTSYYTDGLVIIDASRPDNLVEVGRYDTYVNLSPTTGFYGAWGAYPYSPSGLVLVSDINTGLHVLQPNYQRACWLEGVVTDQNTGASIFGVDIQLDLTNVEEETDLSGEYKTGIGIAGTYDLLVSKAGYYPQRIPVTLTNGQVTIQNIQLVPAATFSMTGQVVDDVTSAPIPNAFVRLKSNMYEYDVQADASGNFSLQIYPDFDYEIIAGQWGHRAKLFNSTGLDSMVISGNIYPLKEGYRDEFVFDYGWTEFGDASSGNWEVGIPDPIVSWRGNALPDEGDLDGDIGDGCLITGNNDNGQLGVDDVDDGFTTAVSPVMDLTSYGRPSLNFHYFITVNAPASPSDRLVVYMTNGTDTAELFNTATPNYAWSVNQSYDIKNYLSLTNDMRVYFQANDSSSTIVEMLIDAFEISDTTSINTVRIEKENWATVKAYPNPFGQTITVDYAFEQTLVERPTLLVCNALGQVIEQRQLQQQADQLRLGATWPAGIYFVRIGRQSVRVVKQ